MRFCDTHWDSLREEIDNKGLGTLISETGEEALRKIRVQEMEGQITIDNFDPLMFAMWEIVDNCGQHIMRIGGNPTYWFIEGPEDPVDTRVYSFIYSGRTWPRCPVCYVNLVHEMTCAGCDLPKKTGYDWMIERSAQDALNRWRSFLQ